MRYHQFNRLRSGQISSGGQKSWVHSPPSRPASGFCGSAVSVETDSLFGASTPARVDRFSIGLESCQVADVGAAVVVAESLLAMIGRLSARVPRPQLWCRSRR